MPSRAVKPGNGEIMSPIEITIVVLLLAAVVLFDAAYNG
jgi:hypothetical protein